MGFPWQLRALIFQARVRDRLDELVELRLIVKQNAGITVILARVTAAADFYHLGAQGLEVGRASGRGVSPMTLVRTPNFMRKTLLHQAESSRGKPLAPAF